jgi:superoxide dismutase, Fe-Mn family
MEVNVAVQTAMSYKAKDFTKLLGMAGFSDTLLKNHFTLYEGYINNTNKLIDTLMKTPKDAMNPQYAELKRRFGFEFDGMRLHELYFENLGGKAEFDKGGKLGKKFADCFGSSEDWEADFKATGKIRGVGWTILYQDNANGECFNQWIDEHENNHPAGCKPILVMDVWEHAFTIDYGLKRADYIDAFFKNINWGVVQSRLI